MKWLGILSVVALLAGIPGYGNAQQTGEKSALPTQPQSQVEKGKPAQALKTYTQKERKDYEEKTAAELAGMQQKLDALKSKQETAPIQMKRMILKGLVNLQRGVYTGQNQLTAMKTASAESWSGMRANLDKDIEEWNKAYEAFAARIK